MINFGLLARGQTGLKGPDFESQRVAPRSIGTKKSPTMSCVDVSIVGLWKASFRPIQEVVDEEREE